MDSINRSRLLTLLLSGLVVGVALGGPKRIPNGQTIDVCAVVALHGTADITTAKMVECDPGQDDDMGPCSLSEVNGATKITSSITNNGGMLSGPNGVVQTGSGEGQEIEVKFVVEQTSVQQVTILGVSFPMVVTVEVEIPLGNFIGT